MDLHLKAAPSTSTLHGERKDERTAEVCEGNPQYLPAVNTWLREGLVDSYIDSTVFLFSQRTGLSRAIHPLPPRILARSWRAMSIFQGVPSKDTRTRNFQIYRSIYGGRSRSLHCFEKTFPLCLFFFLLLLFLPIPSSLFFVSLRFGRCDCRTSLFHEARYGMRGEEGKRRRRGKDGIERSVDFIGEICSRSFPSLLSYRESEKREG